MKPCTHGDRAKPQRETNPKLARFGEKRQLNGTPPVELGCQVGAAPATTKNWVLIFRRRVTNYDERGAVDRFRLGAGGWAPGIAAFPDLGLEVQWLREWSHSTNPRQIGEPVPAWRDPLCLSPSSWGAPYPARPTGSHPANRSNSTVPTFTTNTTGQWAN